MGKNKLKVGKDSFNDYYYDMVLMSNCKGKMYDSESIYVYIYFFFVYCTVCA